MRSLSVSSRMGIRDGGVVPYDDVRIAWDKSLGATFRVLIASRTMYWLVLRELPSRPCEY